MLVSSMPIAGCMRWGKWGAGFSTAEYATIINDCIENGITSFDHADIYGDYTTEEEFGTAFKTMKTVRSKIQLITKCGIGIVSTNRPGNTIKFYNTSKEHI